MYTRTSYTRYYNAYFSDRRFVFTRCNLGAIEMMYFATLLMNEFHSLVFYRTSYSSFNSVRFRNKNGVTPCRQ